MKYIYIILYILLLLFILKIFINQDIQFFNDFD